jgi:hypothetical protein
MSAADCRRHNYLLVELLAASLFLPSHLLDVVYRYCIVYVHLHPGYDLELFSLAAMLLHQHSSPRNRMRQLLHLS